MRWRIVACVAGALVQSSYAAAQNHEQICVPSVINGRNVSIISKEKLAKAILNQNSDWQALYINADAPASDPKYQPQWRGIFTDPNFCRNNPGCLSKNPKTNKLDDSAAQDTLIQLQTALADFIQTQTTSRQYYRTANPEIGPDYLLGADTVNPIFRVGPELPPVAKAAPGISLPIRLRANSDDLNIDKQKSEFKSLKPATVSFTRDGAAGKTSASLQAALGYPIPLNFARPPGATSFSAEVVPYVAAAQSYSKVGGKAATYGDTNNWAVGALFDASANFVGAESVNNVFMAKPQYLWNTKDRSQIASGKLIWQPWTQNLAPGGLPPINSVFPLGPASAGYHAQLLFDLRFDAGLYANKGDDPTTIARHKSFARGGSIFGFAVSTPALGPYMTLRVTETLLDGFAGEVPYISLLQAALVLTSLIRPEGQRNENRNANPSSNGQCETKSWSPRCGSKRDGSLRLANFLEHPSVLQKALIWIRYVGIDHILVIVLYVNDGGFVRFLPRHQKQKVA
jgi:hypothetical protein